MEACEYCSTQQRGMDLDVYDFNSNMEVMHFCSWEHLRIYATIRAKNEPRKEKPP